MPLTHRQVAIAISLSDSLKGLLGSFRVEGGTDFDFKKLAETEKASKKASSLLNEFMSVMTAIGDTDIGQIALSEMQSPDGLDGIDSLMNSLQDSEDGEGVEDDLADGDGNSDGDGGDLLGKESR